jgi:hypothetical protein
VLWLLTCLSAPTTELREVRALFEHAVVDTGRHGDIPVYILTALPKQFSIDGKAVVIGDERKTGYGLALYAEEGIGDAGYIAGIAGTKSANSATEDIPDTKPVKLANGATAKFRPVSCGGSCAPANLWWRIPSAVYTIQLRLDPRLGSDKQLQLLLEVANSIALASQQ